MDSQAERWTPRQRSVYPQGLEAAFCAAPGYPRFLHPLPSIAVPNSTSLRPVSPVNPLNDEQRKAAAALLRRVSPAADELGLLFAGMATNSPWSVARSAMSFSAVQPGDLDLTTDAPPAESSRSSTAGPTRYGP